MPLYEVTEAGLEERAVEQFADLGMYERGDLQRLLRDKIDALDNSLLVVAEEFGTWQDSRRRIDLLALDKAGRLVVIELKRTDDGGHMDLQAIRYAAMVSAMSFADVADAYGAHLARHRPGDEVDARGELAKFLEVSSDGEEPALSTEVRIVLVSADFNREITTTALWLNRLEGMDIRCVRLTPYLIGERVVLDLRQVVPLPQAEDYVVRLGRKEAARERTRTTGRDLTRYHIVVDGEPLPALAKRQAARTMIEHLAARGVPLTEIFDQLSDGSARVLAGVHPDGSAARAALMDADPGADPVRFFCDHPLIDERANLTYLITNQWGTDTESALQRLADAFPDIGLSFRRAD